MKKKPEKSLIESLAEMGRNDPEFRREMDVLFIDTLKEFFAAYKQGMQQANLEILSFAIHKIKFAVEMYGIQALYLEAENGRQMVTNKTNNAQAVNVSVAKVEQLCSAQISQLKKQLG